MNDEFEHDNGQGKRMAGQLLRRPAMMGPVDTKFMGLESGSPPIGPTEAVRSSSYQCFAMPVSILPENCKTILVTKSHAAQTLISLDDTSLKIRSRQPMSLAHPPF